MRIVLKTQVPGHFKDVMSQFDRELFEYLAPPLAKMELVEFGGSETGDVVHLKFTFPVQAEWKSLITDHGESEDESYFVDEGDKLPWPLKSWRHYHGVQGLGDNKSILVDDIQYDTGIWLGNVLMWPIMYVSFWGRKPQYKKYFSRSTL